MKKIFLIILVFIQVAGMAQQRGTSDFHVNWEFGVPVGNNFITNFSALGFNIGYGKFIKDDLAVGFDLGWNNYYQYAPTKTYEYPGGAATTDLYKYIHTLPMTLYAVHYFHTESIFAPFVKLGLGAQYSEQNIYYNVYETTNENWGFTAIPEIGTVVHFRKDNPWGLYTSVRYKYSTNKAEVFGINNVSSINFNVGLAYLLKH
ncbi:MAG TPA: hypothetical protein VG890_06740 [Puia sp.]|nr:hypothetical protein [Puia sp.]